jgi:hypothetical protein
VAEILLGRPGDQNPKGAHPSSNAPLPLQVNTWAHPCAQR